MDVARTPAAALVRVGCGVLSHGTAAVVHGLDLVEAPERCSLTVPRSHSRLVLPGWDVHRRALPPGDIQHRADGTRVTTVERTVADLARALPLGEAVAVADSALRARLVTVPDLTARLTAERGNLASRCRDVLQLLDPAAESVLESLVRVVLWTGSWSPPVTQHTVFDVTGGVAARIDFAWPDVRLAVEADGFAAHSDRAAFRSDRERLNRLVSLGWRVLRVTWEDARGRPAYITALVEESLRVAGASGLRIAA